AERRQAPPGAAPRDLFDALLQARDPESGRVFSPEQLHDQVATLLVAGHETTAVALFWSLYLLAMAPEVQIGVAAELAEMALDGDPADAVLPQLILTRAVVDEAMRLFPPAFAIVRAAAEPTAIAGIPVGRGTLLIV